MSSTSVPWPASATFEEPGTKSGTKYEDADGDGDITEDTGNPLGSWVINAYADDGDGDGELSATEYSTATILADWSIAMAGGTAGFKTFHAKYDAANNLGCPIG